MIRRKDDNYRICKECLNLVSTFDWALRDVSKPALNPEFNSRIR